MSSEIISREFCFLRRRLTPGEKVDFSNREIGRGPDFICLLDGLGIKLLPPGKPGVDEAL